MSCMHCRRIGSSASYAARSSSTQRTNLSMDHVLKTALVLPSSSFRLAIARSWRSDSITEATMSSSMLMISLNLAHGKRNASGKAFPPSASARHSSSACRLMASSWAHSTEPRFCTASHLAWFSRSVRTIVRTRCRRASVLWSCAFKAEVADDGGDEISGTVGLCGRGRRLFDWFREQLKNDSSTSNRRKNTRIELAAKRSRNHNRARNNRVLPVENPVVILWKSIRSEIFDECKQQRCRFRVSTYCYTKCYTNICKQQFWHFMSTLSINWHISKSPNVSKVY